MISDAQQQQHQQWLLELTAIPTAAGCEQRVMAWVKQWVNERKNLALREDKAGNLLIIRKGASGKRSSKKPLLITAHLDHPAFVVREILGEDILELEFRGGVHDPYFENAAIDVFDAHDQSHRATVTHLDSSAKPFKRAKAWLAKPTNALKRGDVGRWALESDQPLPRIENGLLYTQACDDLAALAAALSVLEVLRSRKGFEHVGVLLTRAEEIGFIGAIAACKFKSVSKKARLICLENSRSFTESPIGAGTIVRVGDKMSVFNPAITNRISMIMAAHQQANPQYKFQRKLMPGGTCEATTFSTYGYESTCLCLPLGNYHNMVDIDGVIAGKQPAKVGPEFISVDDYHGLIEMLIVCAQQLDSAKAPTLEARMEGLFKEFKFVLSER